VNLEAAAAEVRACIRGATVGLVGREQLAELMVLGAVSGEHLLVVGPPGTAKSAVVRRVAQALGGRYFEYLLGRFTEPSEIFGPVDLRKLREGTVETDVTGMLPEAEVAFLDEVFLGSTAILNTLLGVLNERRFRRGHTQVECPLRICVGAANALPEDDSLAAFADRFLLHLFVEPVEDHQLESMLEGGWRSDHNKVESKPSLTALDQLRSVVPSVKMDGAQRLLAQAIRQLRQAGLNLSDRRIVKVQGLMAAAAVLAGRREVLSADLWPILYALPTADLQASGREVLKSLLAQAEHPILLSAVEQATLQPLSRAARLCESAELWLGAASRPRSQAEALLREMDANFSDETRPPDLSRLRAALSSGLVAGN